MDRPDRMHLWVGGALFLLALVASWLFTDFVTGTGDRLERDRILSLARTAAATLESPRIAALQGSPADIGSAGFDGVRDELRRARDVNPDFRFVYLMRPSGDALVFIADAEAPESADYSAPGDAYDGPSDELWRVYRTGIPEIQPPYQDRWGYWVTAVAPVRNASGQVIAILGMDVRADAWLATQARYRAFALTISALLLSLVALFTLGLHLQKRSAGRLAALNGQLAHRLDELQQAQEGLRLADVVVRHAGEGILVLDPELRVLSANPGFERITGHSASAVLGQVPPLFAEDSDVLQQIRSRLQTGVHWEGTLWSRRADGDRFPLEASLDVVRDAAGKIEHHVMVFRDVTVQKQLEDRLRELSATDGLTLLANRRSFDEALEREWHRATRHGEPVSLIMADIDHFKPYNDLYGHVAGDRCLQQVAAAIAAGVKLEGAVVARYGGEEFAVILPRTDEAGAQEMAEHLRRRVEALGIAHGGNPVGGRVTISMGTSTRTPPQAADFVSLMQSADQALYRAKGAGRNTVSSAE
ncbi:MAG: diguanylate cyclase [Arenimonas sp.]|uniref:sensor domain-containing diguanylate cyclase n=1 Tax=Arenimonas sp. TaxID=1872635 RepID=UPI0025BC7F98|nr:diguanylate cyclase [Arenimonas sp.]MBW8368245.1 diguanylate cyclase [Arenimonas sp.]